MRVGNHLMYSGVPGRRILAAGRSTTGFNGFGTTGIQAASSTASLAKTGGAIGTAIGPEGTVIGLAVGAALGVALALMSHQGQKPQRLAAAQKILAQIRAFSPNMAGRTVKWDNVGGGISDLMFEALYLGGGFLGYQGSTLTDHPSSMWQWTQWFMQGTGAVVQAAAQNPVGATVTVNVMTGYKQALPFTFTNPGLIDATTFAQTVLMPMVNVIIDGKHTNPAAGVAASVNNQDAIHVFALLYDYYLSLIAPQAASSSVATPIMQVPTVQAAIPSAVYQPTIAPVYQQSAAPVNTVQTTAGQTVDVNALVASLQAQGASQSQAYSTALAQLQAAGVQPTAQVQQQVATAVTAPTTAGFSTIEIIFLAAVGIPLVLGALKGK
jgi:hypothetical protein